MKNTKILLSVLIILLILAVFISIYTSQPNPRPSPSPSPIEVIQQAPNPFSSVIPRVGFKISGTVPDLTKGNLLRIDTGLVIIFSKPINPSDLLYEIIPPTSTTSELNSSATRFTIRGDPFWPDNGSFRLIINSKSKSESNEELGSDYTFEFRTGLPEGI